MFSHANLLKLRDLCGIWKYRSQHKKQSPRLTASLLLASTTLAIAIIGVASYKVVREIILKQLQEKVLLEVRQGTNEIDQWLATSSSEVQTIANTDIVRSLNWSVMEPYLQAEVKRINKFFVIGVTYPDGFYYTTQLGKTNKKNNDRDFVKKALAGQVNISDPFMGRASKTPTIAIASPIRQSYDPASPPIAVIFGSLNVNRVTQVVNRLNYGKGSYAFALNSQGQAIIHPNPELMFIAEKPAPSFLKSSDANLAAIASQMVNRKQGIELISIDGTNKYVAYVPLKQANWSIALVIPRENIESQLQALNLLASILGGLLLVAAIFAWRQIKLSEQAQSQVILLSQQQKTLQQQAQELKQTLLELQQTQTQLIQTEKMSSLGQLIAGVAHEINNPVSFIYGNLTHANEYTQDLLRLLQLYQQYYPEPAPEIQDEIETLEIDFLMADLPKLLTSMKVGADRIKQIVLSLRNFSRLDEAEMKAVNIHEGIDSTLMILEHRLKATSERPAIEVIKEYGELPPVECFVGQLNQVFMNILTNAIDAVEQSSEILTKPQIRIATRLNDNQHVTIRIADNGVGIAESIQKQLFDPFFTTKPVGKGTGLGLSISYQIITEKHGGQLKCISAIGEGTEFVITIPLHQTKAQV
ncbi:MULTISPECIES: sensor histidine kinase [Fischerella]|uniref:histidine kinase n=1 Tax=Fischerella muscicola CCMEE 5323 TaxID=2019572 RepID=A0A2N6K1F9_FISMU|nr:MULTISPECIES: ATP-binding protein [Fischerella]MBD2433696.1 sensor histidine kinase [Fischerella sp. FACHB-380]PLZ88374.1 histidine kinase [Fischerella muscicola CCMEE 5323]